MRLFGTIVFVWAVFTSSAWSAPDPVEARPTLSGRELGTSYAAPRRVTVLGYTGHMLDPFVSRDGRYVLFSNKGSGRDLHYAVRKEPDTFIYKGRLSSLNVQGLAGMPTIDWRGALYFISAKAIGAAGAAIYRTNFVGGTTSRALFVEGDFGGRGRFNMDVEISADGGTLYVSRAVKTWFQAAPRQSNIVLAMRTGSHRFQLVPEGETIMAQINTNDLEYGPSVSPDETIIFFTRSTPRAFQKKSSEGNGIYVAVRDTLDVPFSDVTLLSALKGFVGSPALADRGCSLYYHRNDPDFYSVYRSVRQDCQAEIERPISRRRDVILIPHD